MRKQTSEDQDARRMAMSVNGFEDSQAGALDAALADLLDLSLLAKQAHWNVTGPRFRSLHELFDELASVARASADRVAERSVTLGHAPDARVETVTRLSSLPTLDSGPQTDRATLVAFAAILDAMISRLYALLEAFASDLVTVDLSTSVLAEIERFAWMFRAQQGN
jgi:starvation-inducible DNA-binding protein